MPDKQILSVTEQGIRYQDETSIEKFIDFSVCYENYLKWQLAPENLKRIQAINRISDDDMPKSIERYKRFKAVGKRNSIAHPKPYLEFYTDPPTRFEFATQDEYREFRYSFEQFGWKTMDLS